MVIHHFPKLDTHSCMQNAGVQPVLCGDVCEGSKNVDIDGSSAVSEVYQAEQVKDGQIESQGQSKYVLRLAYFFKNLKNETRLLEFLMFTEVRTIRVNSLHGQCGLVQF